MLTFEQFYQKELKESKRIMSRFYHHVSKDPFMIIMSVEHSPYEIGIERYPNADKKDEQKLREYGEHINNLNTSTFRHNLSKFKSGFIPLLGKYNEPSWKDPKTTVEVYEDSTAIYCTETNKDKLYQFCLDQARKHKQHTILVVEKQIGYLVNCQTGKRTRQGPFHPETFDKSCSWLINRKGFVFVDKPKVVKQLQKVFEPIKD